MFRGRKRRFASCVAGLEVEELGVDALGTLVVLGRELMGVGRATLNAAGTGVAGVTALPPTPLAIVVHPFG